MKRRTEIIVAIVIILALILLLFFLLRKPAAEEVVPEPVQDFPTTADGRVIERVSEVASDTIEAPVDAIARTFVERFGSFSSDVDYINVEEVKQLATTGLAVQLDTLLANVRGETSSSYYGVSTRVITLDVTTNSETSATVEITTQREESIDSPSNTSVRYQDITLDLTKSGDKWLVSSFTWGE